MTPLDAALGYAARGWRVVPIGAGTKFPDLTAWHREATTDPATIAKWYQDKPGRGVGIATGDGLLVVDVDTANGKVGAESLAALELAHGPLPSTVEAITGSGGRHLYFTYPPNVTGTVNIGNSAGRLGPDLDIRANGGQVVAPPTRHPTTGQPYAWNLEQHPDLVKVAAAPSWLLGLLREEAKSEGDRAPVDVADAYASAVLAADRYNYHPQAALNVEGLLVDRGWQRHHVDRQGVVYVTRPGKDVREGHSATIGALELPGALRCFTGSCPPLDAERSYDPSDLLTLMAFGGDQAAAEAWLVPNYGGEATAPVPAVSILGTIKPRVTGDMAVEGLHLPDAFWNARPELAHIRQASRHALVAADAVLGTVLTRVAACTPYTVEIPGIVGRPMGLTFYAASVGSPSAGKSAAADVGADLLPAPVGVLDRMPVGSGEGFVECLFEMVDQIDPTDENGKRRIKVKVQTKYAAIFAIDEGTVLGDLGQRSGTTIMPTLRSAFTHGTLGATNASAERKRLLKGTEYVYGVTMGIQPEKAGPLLSDAAAGTPQRFVWLMATDPTISDEDVADPGPLPWCPPDSVTMNNHAVTRSNGLRRPQISVAPEIRREIRQQRLEGLRGAVVEDGDAHATLVRLKAAALLALLNLRMDVCMDDWELAGQIVATSRVVRLAVESSLRRVETAKDDAHIAKLARREEVLTETAGTKALRSGAASAAKVVRRHSAERHHGDTSTCARRCLHGAVASAHRDLVGLDAIIDEAARLDWILAVGDRFTPGGSAAL